MTPRFRSIEKNTESSFSFVILDFSVNCVTAAVDDGMYVVSVDSSVFSLHDVAIPVSAIRHTNRTQLPIDEILNFTFNIFGALARCFKLQI